MPNDSITVAAIQALPMGYLMNPENVPHAVGLLKEAISLGAELITVRQ